MIVKTQSYTREEVGKVVQLRALIEGLKLGPSVLDRLAAEGEKSSLRFVLCFWLNNTNDILVNGHSDMHCSYLHQLRSLQASLGELR